MATVIRFARHGTKKKPFYRIVVQDHHKPRDGKFIEKIGVYDPIKEAKSLTIQRARLEYWLSTGAKMSDSVRTRLKPTMKEWALQNPIVSAPKVKVPKEAKKPAKAKSSTKSKEA